MCQTWLESPKKMFQKHALLFLHKIAHSSAIQCKITSNPHQTCIKSIPDKMGI